MPSVTRKTKAGRTRRDTVRDEVLEATGRLLAAGESYTSLGVARICEEAGVARSAFYTNFRDKTDLLMQLAASATGEIFTGEWIASGGEDGMEGLVQTYVRTVGVFRRNAAVLAAYAEVAAYDSDVAHLWQSRLDELIEALTERIAAEQVAGRIRPALVPGTAAAFIVWGAERTVSQHVAADDGTNDYSFARGMAEAVWVLLYGTAPDM